MLTRSTSQPAQTKYRGPEGKRAYAIGDVHGCFDLMMRLLGQIEEDVSKRSEKSTFIVFLGDLIDRGAHSRHVVEHLIAAAPDFARIIFIKGNHEDSLVRGLTGEPNLLKPWLEHGGYACAASYGVPQHVLAGQTDEIIEHTLVSAIPSAHVRFLDSFVDSVVFGDYLMVHAGVRPGIELDAQRPRDMRWIRQEFLESREDFGKRVVHGHSVTEEVDFRANRIGVDTGAYLGNALSCIRIENEEVEVIQAGKELNQSITARLSKNLLSGVYKPVGRR
jgi:serine/threonine protein phosphatase 1